jgi:hypothetical protein
MWLPGMWLTTIAALSQHCSLNGRYDLARGLCDCDAGWKGPSCAQLDLLPASPTAYGLHFDATPTWGGTAVFDKNQQRWSLIVGSRASAADGNDSKTDYPCDSRIVRAVSHGADAAGPYTIAEVLFPRSSWEPALARAPTVGRWNGARMHVTNG